ncbi:ephrin type-B receptor 3-like [Stylophora pistillata]|uniref:ephrin type-B receptor 3-like n=1 Tax=Stylophora pistillata TaxID=50429 RepID=UPI000C03D7CA|nr:ephrin type-B receptor 3-like [Stylophora pistillata]
MKLFLTILVLRLVAILRGVSGEAETLLEEPGSDWHWAIFKDSWEGAGWIRLWDHWTQSPTYRICDTTNRKQKPKNWLLTDFLNTKDATRLDIVVTYTLRNCPSANVWPFCRKDFTLYSYHTDHILDSSPDPTRLNFHKETVITPKTLPAPLESTTDTFYGSIVTKAKGIYLALLDQGACLTISKFVVRYNFCSETVVASFVRFPRTIAPVNDINLTKQEGECADPNSHNIYNTKLFGVCFSNGEWNITANSICFGAEEWNITVNSLCLCDYAYELTNGSSDSFVCRECQKGFYKDSVGNEKCRPCPANSVSNTDRTGCMCNEGYYQPSNVVDCEAFTRNAINITMVIANERCTYGNYDQSSLLTRLQKVLEEAFAERFAGLRGALLKNSIRCGSIIADLALIFHSKTKEQDVITVLRNASNDGKLGNFTVSAINRTRMRVNFETRTTEAETATPPGSTTGIFTGAVIGSTAILVEKA